MTGQEFDQMLRRRAQEEDCPVPKEFKQKIDSLLEKLPDPRRRRVPRAALRMLLAAAVTVGLLASAAALSPSLRELLEGVLGGFAPYAQEVEGVVAVDQGIEIRAVSALADEHNGLVYLEIKDLTGDRLESGMTISLGRGFTARSFDPETGTALVEVPIENRVDMMTNMTEAGKEYPPLSDLSPYPMRFTTIYPTGRLTFENIPIPWDQINDRVLDSYKLPQEEETLRDWDDIVLTPNQTPMALEGTDLISLSSMGYDSYGNFHIQVALAEGVDWSERAVNDDFDDRMSFTTDYYHRYPYPSQHHIIDGRYYDITFYGARQERLEDILPKTFSGYARQSAPITGEWVLRVPLETVPNRVVTMHEAIGMKYMAVESITFNALGLRAAGSTAPGHGGGLGIFPVTLYLADGSTYAVPDNGSGSGGSVDEKPGTFYTEWRYDKPIESDQIVGVSLGYWMIPIQGGTGGPGYWLKELPQ